MIKYRYKKNRRGGVLALVIIIMAVLSVLGTVALRVAVAENNFAGRHEDKLQAYYLARSGAQSVTEYMIRDASSDAHEIVDKVSEWNEQISGGRFMVEVNSVPSSRDIDIISTGEYGGIQQQVKIRVTGSSTGIGGIFQYAIASKDGISTANASGQGIEIIGSVATKNGTINLGSNGKTTGDNVTDPNLIFPNIVLPPDRNPAVAYDPDPIIGNVVNTVNTNPKYVRLSNLNLHNSTFKVTGNGVAHLYVQGDIDMKNSSFDVANTAKLYVYVVGSRTVEFAGNGAQNNLFIYAPDSDIEWNNSGAGDFIGSLIGKTVKLHNHTVIKYNPNMANDIELDVTGSGVTYTGYIWID